MSRRTHRLSRVDRFARAVRSPGAVAGFILLGLLGLVIAAEQDATVLVGPPGAQVEVSADAYRRPAVGTDPVVASSEALELLGGLSVKGRAPKTGYDRDEFGDGWPDVDFNGCDTRNDVLARDLDGEQLRGGRCVVVSGTLVDPYTSDTVLFTYGRATSDDVQIDHVVALSNAWQTGAQQLTREQRIAFANDPLNLQATIGAVNAAKGDGDAATWLPPDRASWCAYAAIQVQVKAKYGLWVTPPEHAALVRILGGCPDEPLSELGGMAP
jgi:Protein of unknown function (DUF1524)